MLRCVLRACKQVMAAVGLRGERPDLPDDLDPSVIALITDCWAQAPSARPSFTQVCCKGVGGGALRR